MRRLRAPEQLDALLRALPAGEATRISVARDCDVFATGDGEDSTFVVELGGFLVTGPVGADEIARRWGPDGYRVTAVGFDPPGLRWEVFAPVDPLA